ncbi:MAG: PilT/PilU family type 4a pilus ATPase [Verrucomicrobiota bacterium]|jgi:twitching motility protein PilT
MDTFRKILSTAVEGGASDVHLKIGAPIIFRINRRLVVVDGPFPTAEWMEMVVGNILPRHHKAHIEETREVDFSYFMPGVGRFRTNCFHQRGEYCLALRYVKTQVPSFEELGLLPQLRQIAESPRGIVLLAGSTGCGKSTTLAAMVEHINANGRKHIITLEDPIEYVFEDNQSVIEQREIGLDTRSFEEGLKHVLRQDPDVIMIGEMRDATSFTAAMAAADTGHLVLSTLHTTNAAHSISRILDFFKADERDQIRRQIAGTLQAVVCQRMVPTIAGGMTPAQEIMINSGTVRKLIEENRLERLGAAIETGSEEGMLNFNQSLFNLVKDGKVSQADALAKATNAQALEMNFQGIFLTEGKRILG